MILIALSQFAYRCDCFFFLYIRRKKNIYNNETLIRPECHFIHIPMFFFIAQVTRMTSLYLNRRIHVMFSTNLSQFFVTRNEEGIVNQFVFREMKKNKTKLFVVWKIVFGKCGRREETREMLIGICFRWKIGIWTLSLSIKRSLIKKTPMYKRTFMVK